MLQRSPNATRPAVSVSHSASDAPAASEIAVCWVKHASRYGTTGSGTTSTAASLWTRTVRRWADAPRYTLLDAWVVIRQVAPGPTSTSSAT